MHLEYFRIKGYRSIQDCEITLRDGLNIMIGYNGAGKTNVLNAIYNAFQITNKQSIESELFDFTTNTGNFLIKTSVNTEIIFNDDAKGEHLITEIYRDGIQEELHNFSLKFDPTYIIKIPFFSSDFDINKRLSIPLSANSDEKYAKKNDNLPNYLDIRYDLIALLSLNVLKLNRDTIEDIVRFLNIDSDVKESIKRISFIEDIIIEEYALNSLINADKYFKIENFIYRFIIDKKRLLFDQLSDGTKRLLYGIFSLYSQYGYSFSKSGEVLRLNYIDDSDDLINTVLRLLLWEEPEIGLHPHQLFELMNIVKEQSRYKQILISTHSPIVLNCLGPDELDRIIICDYIKGQGTKLRHLTEKEMDKARAYMKDVGFLSDYWMHSDLQKWQRNP